MPTNPAINAVPTEITVVPTIAFNSPPPTPVEFSVNTDHCQCGSAWRVMLIRTQNTGTTTSKREIEQRDHQSRFIDRLRRAVFDLDWTNDFFFTPFTLSIGNALIAPPCRREVRFADPIDG